MLNIMKPPPEYNAPPYPNYAPVSGTAHPAGKEKTMLESKTPFESKTFKRAYLISSVIVWVGILFGTAIILSRTPYFAQILPILSVGVFWFIVLLPGAYFWTHPKSDQPSATKSAERTPIM